MIPHYFCVSLAGIAVCPVPALMRLLTLCVVPTVWSSFLRVTLAAKQEPRSRW